MPSSPPSAQLASEGYGQSHRRKIGSNPIMGYDPHVVLIAAAIGLLLLFIRIGPFLFLLIFLISFTLSALPDFRNVVDSTLGTALSTQPRLQQTFASIGLQLKPSHQSINQLTTLDLDHSTQNLHKFDQFPDQLQAAFDALLSVIIRDYVEGWYLLPTVSTGDKAFLHQLRHALDHIILKAYVKLTTKSSKETMIYLIGCLSMNLIRELNDRSNSKSQPSARDRIIQRQVQTRRISEEILLTLGSPSITSSPLTLNLATEILTVQLISITRAYNHDWFNQTLIDSLGSETSQVSLASSSSAPSNPATTMPAPPFDPINQDSNHPDLQASRRISPSPSKTTHLSQSINPHPTVSCIPDDANPVQGNNILIAYLKSPGNSILGAGTSLNTDVSLQDLFDRTPKWTPKINLPESERSSLLSSSHDQLAETFIKLFNQLELFQSTSRSTHLKFDIFKADAISVLSALTPLIQHALDQLITTQSDPDYKDYISTTWLSVIVETLRRLELGPATDSNIFSNLQEWLLDQLQSLKFTRVSGSSRHVDNDQTTTQPFQQDKIYYMTLPNIPASGSSNDVHTQAQPSQDLASTRSEGTQGEFQNSATEAALNRHRAMSMARNAPSPASSPDWGAHPRSKSTHDHFGSPNQRRPSSGYAQPISFPYRVPEEGDMTEGYSLDEASEKEDICYSPLDQYATTQPPTTSSSGFDDKNSSHSGSRSTSVILSSFSHGSQLASFSVSVTDMSPSSAIDSKTGTIKQKKDILLLIAVENSPEPGFIVTRGWPELERMDLAINKKKPVGVGTKAFPRALLPTNLNLKTIDHVRRELEAYLECLLKDERYSKSEPVLKFFAKERSGMSGRGGAINNILNSTSSTLDSIGKGVASVGKEVVSKPVDFATLGLNKLSKGVFSGLPFGASPATLRDEDEAQPQFQFRSSLDAPYGFTSESSISPERVNDTQNDHDGNYLESDATDPEGRRQKHEKHSTETKSNFTTADDQSISEPPLTSILVKKTDPSISSNSPQCELSNMDRSTRSSSATKTESTVSKEFTQTNKPLGPEKSHKQAAPSTDKSNNPSTTNSVALSGNEFDAVIIAIMSILEAAYGLGQNNNTPWSMKRGVLRVLETILRTTSFSDFIRTNLCKFAEKYGQVETYVDLINSVLISLTSNSEEPERKDGISDQNNENNNIKGRSKLDRTSTKSISSIDSLDSLGENCNLSSSEDIDNQYRSLVSDPSEHQSQPLYNSKKDPKKETARKLFIDCWSNLKIGLGSNATDLAANKVFELFQEFNHQEPNKNQLTEDQHQDQSSFEANHTGGNGKFNAYSESATFNLANHKIDDNIHTTSGIELIVHNLLLDLIRITLLL